MNSPESYIPPGFTQVTEGGVRLVVREEMVVPVIEALRPLRGAWKRLSRGNFTARGRAGVATISVEGDTPNLIVRRYVHGGIFARITRSLYFGGERAIMELSVSEAARAGGVSTAKVVGVLVSPCFGPFRRLALISEEISDSEDLVHYCCRLNDYPPETAAIEKRGVLVEAAEQIRKMHDLGLFHADLHLKNLLLRRRELETPAVHIIDFDRATMSGELSAGQRLCNLKRLARSVRKMRVAQQVLSDWDRLRFLRAYLRGMPDARKLLRKWARKLANTGSGREAWWTLTRTQRVLRGDQIGMQLPGGKQR